MCSHEKYTCTNISGCQQAWFYTIFTPTLNIVRVKGQCLLLPFSLVLIQNDPYGWLCARSLVYIETVCQNTGIHRNCLSKALTYTDTVDHSTGMHLDCFCKPLGYTIPMFVLFRHTYTSVTHTPTTSGQHYSCIHICLIMAACV